MLSDKGRIASQGRKGKADPPRQDSGRCQGTEPVVHLTFSLWAGPASPFPRPERNNLSHLHLEFTLSWVTEAPTPFCQALLHQVTDNYY